MNTLRKDALLNRQRIENKAIELFKQYGVETISMNRISKELGIGMGTLYRHFKDKSDLCYHIIEHDFDEIIQKMNDVAASSNSKEEKMEHSLDVFLTFKYENSDLLNCIEESNSKSQFHQSQFFSDLFNFYYDLFKDGEDDSWAIFKTDMLLKSLSTKAYEIQKNKRQLSNNEIRDNLIKLYLN